MESIDQDPAVGPKSSDPPPPASGDAGDENEKVHALDAAGQARLRALFDAHYDAIWRMLRRLGLDPSSADDGAQQVFIVASRRLSDIEAGKERSFLYASAARIASRARSRARVVRSREDRFDTDRPAGPGDDPTSADVLVDRKRRRELLDSILAEMDEELRVVLVLAEIEDLSKRDIAACLGIPEGTAASRLRRAREDFNARLARAVPKRDR
jgi:RNA polymerase sigma-70 factor (ECF subfamily)